MFVGLNSGLAVANETAPIEGKDLAVFAMTMTATQLLCLTTMNVTIDNLL